MKEKCYKKLRRVWMAKFCLFLYFSALAAAFPVLFDKIKKYNNQHSCKMNDGKYMQTFYER
jgi:hypothetical protein